MLSTILTIIFTIALVALILQLFVIAMKQHWGMVRGILMVAVVPCMLGGLYIIGFWYISVPVLVALLVAARFGKLDNIGKKSKKSNK